ncbi:MAG TPA: hypothetical protein VEU53_04575 [Stellaceae bacterium]|nr:hypothetical protein [Stellaceae bacterium]
MSGPEDMKSAEQAALWRRFRALDRTLRDQAADDADATHALAAYADGRLSEAATEAVEARLAAYPEALDDLMAARSAGDVIAPQRVVDRAAALVSGDSTDGRVVPFRHSGVAYVWRVNMARIAVAACLVLTGLVGFTLGSGVYGNLFPSSDSVSGDTADQPTSFFSTEDAAI